MQGARVGSLVEIPHATRRDQKTNNLSLSLLIYVFTFCRRPLEIVRVFMREPADFPVFFDWGTYFVLLFNGFEGIKLIN